MTRSPGASAGRPRASAAMTMNGGGPSPDQPTGRAMASPSGSVPVIWTIIASGNVSGVRKRRAPAAARFPSRSSPFSRSRSSGFCAGSMPKARAISRLPTRPGASRTKLRISSRVGSSRGAFGVAGGVAGDWAERLDLPGFEIRRAISVRCLAPCGRTNRGRRGRDLLYRRLFRPRLLGWGLFGR